MPMYGIGGTRDGAGMGGARAGAAGTCVGKKYVGAGAAIAAATGVAAFAASALIAACRVRCAWRASAACSRACMSLSARPVKCWSHFTYACHHFHTTTTEKRG
jgi:hypothetical protein